MNINRITIVLSLVLLGLLPGLASAQAWYGTSGCQTSGIAQTSAKEEPK